MRGMAHEVAISPPPLQSIYSKEGSFGSNNSNEPVSVLDTRRSPSPSTSTSTFSSSFGGGPTTNDASSTSTFSSSFGGGPTTNDASVNNIVQKNWPDSVPQEANLAATGVAVACRKDEWSELQPISAGMELQHKRFGVGLDDWERLLSESAGSQEQDHDQSLLRWISGDVDDTSVTLKQLLQVNTHLNFTPQNPQYYNSPVILNPPSPQTQFHHQSHEFLVKKQNQLMSLQQKSMISKQEPPSPDQKQLLLDQLFTAAELMVSGNFSHAQGILARLNHQLPSVIMSPIQRSAFYFKEALLKQMSNSNPIQNPTVSNGIFKMCAYKLLSEVSPVIQFMNFTSNQTIVEARGDSDYIHIIDFDIGFGAQWASFIQELPRKNTNGGDCSLKITAFASPSTHHPVELALMHENLSQFAHEIGISFELEVVNFDSFDPNSFSVSGNAMIAVNFPIWSVSLPAISSLLHLIKRLSPRIVVALDRGYERTDLPFPQYLLHGLEYYEVLLDSIDAANVPPFTANTIENFLLQPQIESMVTGKLQSPVPMPHWKTLFTTGGYSPVALSNFAESQADCVMKRTQVRGFHVEKRHSSLVLCWQNCQLMAVSAWRC